MYHAFGERKSPSSLFISTHELWWSSLLLFLSFSWSFLEIQSSSSQEAVTSKELIKSDNLLSPDSGDRQTNLKKQRTSCITIFISVWVLLYHFHFMSPSSFCYTPTIDILFLYLSHSPALSVSFSWLETVLYFIFIFRLPLLYYSETETYGSRYQNERWRREMFFTENNMHLPLKIRFRKIAT